MNCKKCNHPLPERSNFCLACGYDNSMEEKNFFLKQDDDKKSKRKTVLRILFIIGVLLIIVGSVWMISKYNNSNITNSYSKLVTETVEKEYSSISIWKEYKIVIMTSLIISILIAVFSYFGKEKTFKQSYFKFIIIYILLIFGLLVYLFLFFKALLSSMSFFEFISELTKSLTPFGSLLIALSILLVPFIFNLYYTTIKKINWSLMSLNESKSFVLYFIYYILTIPIISAIYFLAIYFLIKAFDLISKGSLLIENFTRMF